MTLKISKVPDKQVSLSSLKPGDCFGANGEYFQIMPELEEEKAGAVKCFQFRLGNVMYMSRDKVRPVVFDLKEAD